MPSADHFTWECRTAARRTVFLTLLSTQSTAEDPLVEVEIPAGLYDRPVGGLWTARCGLARRSSMRTRVQHDNVPQAADAARRVWIRGVRLLTSPRRRR